jgi:HAD superfamily hydrolase (TIGR01509 family)
MNNYKALIFDLGKVIFDVAFEMAYAHWGKVGKLDSQEVRSRFHFDEAYDLFSENKLSPEEYAKHVSKMIGIELSQEDFEIGWNSVYLDAYPGITDTLIRLKKNYRLVALTNTNSVHARVWPDKYAKQLQHFEKIFSSHEMGTRKPEKLAYTIVLDYLQLSSSETIFLDDTIGNVIGADDVGIKAIAVTSSTQMISDLRQLGIEI